MKIFSTGTILFFCFFSLSMTASENLAEKVANYRKKYSNTELHNQDFKKDFAQLWQLFPRHTLNETIISLKESLIHDFEIREELLKEPDKRDYSFLIRESLYAQNHTAHAYLYNYLIDNPSQENYKWVSFYFEKLTPNDRRTVFDKKLHTAIQNEDNAALCVIIREAQLHGVDDPFRCMAERIFDKDNKRFAAAAIDGLSAKIMLEGPLEAMLKKTSLIDEKMVTFKALLYARHTPSYARELLEQHHNVVPFFITIAERLIKHNSQWQAPICELLSNCFTSESGTTSQLSIATELTKRYVDKESPWHMFSPWLRIVSTHYSMLNEEKSVADNKLIQLTEDLRAINPAKMNAELRSYGEKIAQDLCAWIHRKESKIKNKTTLCDSLLKAGWQAPLQHDVNEKRGGYFYLGEDTWGFAERNNKIVSAELCYIIGDNYADAAQRYTDEPSKKWRLEAYKWFLRAAQKGSIKGFERALQYGIVANKIDLELKEPLDLLVQRYPHDTKVAVLKNLLTLYNLSRRPCATWKEDEKEYLDSCLMFFEKLAKEVAEPALLAQALYAKLYASVLSASCRGNVLIDHSILQVLKGAFSLLDTAFYDDKDTILFDPLHVMPQAFIDALHVTLKNETEMKLTQEERAFVTSILLEQVNYKRFQDYAVIARAVNAITGYDWCKEEAVQIWCENLLKTDSQRLIFLASYDAGGLESYLSSASMLDTMSLKSEECKDSDTKLVQTVMAIAFRKSQLADNLREIAQKNDSEVGCRALRLLLHYELHKTLDEAKSYATRLLDLYKKAENSTGVAKAKECFKHLIEQGVISTTYQIRSGVVEKYDTLFDQLRGGIFTDEDEEALCLLAKDYSKDPIMHILQMGQYALKYHREEDKDALNRIISSLKEARRLGSKIPNSPWFNYITPLTKELLWKEAQMQYVKQAPEMMHDFDVIAYAAFLNKEKSYAEKKQLLQLGLNKHPLCSLLYAEAWLKESECVLSELTVEQALTTFRALRHAMLQGQRSAADLDVATQHGAEVILKRAREQDCLGSAITLASVEPDINKAAQYIGLCPFEVSDNTIFFAPVTDKYISMADEMKIAEPLKRAAEKGNVEAQKAVFRLYFSKALQSTKHEVSEAILSYGLTYIKTADSTQRPPLKRAVEGALENLMKTNIDKATRKRLTKLKTALLLV